MARYALIVGIAKYDRLPSLTKPHTDAEAIAQLLSQYGNFQEIKRLPATWNAEKNGYEVAHKPLSGKELGQTLRQFLLEQADKSEAIIYFSGHGVSIEDNLGRRKGYLVTSDCTLETLDTRGISLESLNQLIEESNLSSLVVLLDCCHAGYALERNLVKQTFTAFSAQKDYYLIAACRGFEKAYEGDSTTEYSFFTETLLRGLSTENAGNDGQVSGDRLFDYISRTLRNSGQEPIRMGWGRSIPLVTNLPQPATSAATPADFNRENPYLGLRAFESDQEEYFCGRVQSVRALLDRLTNNRFLAVIGPSGCGKSSLVRAGLLPQLQRDRLPSSSKWEPEAFTPGNHPLEKLMEALQRHQQQGQPFVLFIDQFEELFTLCEDKAERWNFIRLMAEEATSSERMTRVIVAIRAAFLEQCAPYPEAADLINQARPTTYIVPPLTFPELEAAIEQPASLHGVTFERGLVSQIANDVVERPGALPLLQYALTELWRVCIQEPPSPQPFLTWQGYQAIGGVKGALEQRANLLYQSFSAKDQAFIRGLFLELVQLNEGGEVSRRRATWSDLEALADSPEQLDRVTRLLSGQQQRLIITSDKTVEVAHEALFSEWKLLHDWIEENREDIQINRRLEAACREWQDTYQQSEDALLTGAPLATIEAWAKKSQPKLLPQEAEFLQKSLEKRDRELQSQLEQERRLREEAEARAIAEIEKTLEAEKRANAEAEQAKEATARAKAEKQKTRLTVIVGGLIACSLSLGTFLQYQQVKNQQSKIFFALAVVSKSEQLLNKNNQLEALVASVQAIKQFQEIGIEDENSLNKLKAIIYSVREFNRLEDSQAEITGVSFNPNNNTIASASADGRISIWSIEGRLLKSFKAHKQMIWNLEFSPNGQMIASVSLDRTLKLWTAEGELIKNFSGHSNSVYGVSFSSDSKKVASSGADGTIRVWSTSSYLPLAKPLEIYKLHPELRGNQYIYSIDFSPVDSNKIAYTGTFNNGEVSIWNIKNNTSQTVGMHEGNGSFVRFSHDGKAVASSSYEGKIKLWRMTNGNFNLIKTINAGQGQINSIEYSQDNTMIASAGNDATVKVWSTDKLSTRPLEVLKGHSAATNRVQFRLGDNNMIVSGSDDKTIRLWKIKPMFSGTNQPKKLVDYSCKFLHDYLKTNQGIDQKDRSICN